MVINSIVTVLEDRDFILGFILLTVEKRNVAIFWLLRPACLVSIWLVEYSHIG